jgi:tetratricopeptide (TPR) repeat protein
MTTWKRWSLTKALALVSDPQERYELLLERERVCNSLATATSNARSRRAATTTRAITTRKSPAFITAWHLARKLGRAPAACAALEHSLAAARRANDRSIEADSLHRLASAYWRQGQFSEALTTAQAALQVARAIDDRPREAISLTTMGVVHRTLGDLDSARGCYQQALEIRQVIGDRREIAISLSQLGNLHYDVGNYTEALNHHRQSLEFFRMAGDRRGEAWSTSGLGNVYLHCGDLPAAQASFEQALAIRRDIEDRRGEGVALGDLGNVLLAQGRTKAAIDHLQQAVQLLQDIGARRDEVFALTYLARAFEIANDLENAHSLHQTALDHRRELGQQNPSSTIWPGWRAALQQHDLSKACSYVSDIQAHIRSQGFLVSEAPFLIYLTAIHVMQACGKDEEARQVIVEANHALQARAERISDLALRRSFLEKVPEHITIASLAAALK